MKRIYLMIMFIMILIGASACSKYPKIEDSTAKTLAKEKIELNIGENENPGPMVLYEDKYCFFTCESSNEGKCRIYSGDDVRMKETVLRYETDKNTRLLFTLDNEENVYCIKEKEDKKGYDVSKVDVNGKVVEEFSIETELTFTNVQVDNDGNLYLQSLEWELYLYNLKSQKLTKFEYDGLIIDITRNKDGNMLLYGVGNDIRDVVYQVNPKDMTLQIYVELDAENFLGIEGFASSEEFDFCFDNDDGFWGYSKKENTLHKICDLKQMNIDSASSRFVGEMTDGTYYYYEHDRDSNKNQFYALRESNLVDNRKSLYLVGINIPSVIQSAVHEFNQQNTQYKIELNDFNCYGEEAEKKLTAQISEGKQIDILCLNELNVNDYIEKGVLLDLNKLPEELPKEILLPEIIEATKKEDSLYYITPGFIIQTAITGIPELYNETGIDSAKALEVLQSNQNIDQVSNLSKDAFFKKVCANNVYGNVDEIREFLTDKNALTKLFELTDYIPENSEELTVDKLMDYNILLTSLSIVDFNDFLVYNRMYGESANYIGNITEKGSGCSIDEQGMGVGVYTNSPNKEGATAFLELIMSNEFQEKNCYPNFFPTNQESMNRVVKATMNTEEYIDENGNEIAPYSCEITYDEYTAVITPMTEEEREKFDMLLQKSTESQNADTALIELIAEEAQRYFDNEADLETVISDIQNRTNVYLNEKE